MLNKLLIFLICLTGAIPFSGFSSPVKEKKILVFSKTAGFRHSSAIESGKKTLMELGIKNKFLVDTTENGDVFTDANLQQYAAVVFLCTTGNALNDAQQDAFKKYIQKGGGYVGLHSAADTEYDWPWFGELNGCNCKRQR